MSVEEALSHPYVAAYHDAEDEPAAPSIDPEYFHFEGESHVLNGRFDLTGCPLSCST